MNKWEMAVVLAQIKKGIQMKRVKYFSQQYSVVKTNEQLY